MPDEKGEKKRWRVNAKDNSDQNASARGYLSKREMKKFVEGVQSGGKGFKCRKQTKKVNKTNIGEKEGPEQIREIGGSRLTLN